MKARRLGPRALAVLSLGLTVAVLPLGVAAAAGLTLGSQRLTPYRTCMISATPSSTTAVSDASVAQASPSTNFGASTTNTVTTQNAANRRLYVRFDLSACNPAIPSAATVRLATLRLYESAIPSNCRTVDIFRVTASWIEAGITWNNQPFGTAINNPAAASATGSFTIGTPGGCQNRSANAYIVGTDVTADVTQFVSGFATNYGWMLRDDAEGSGTAYATTLSAKELGNTSQVGQLVVTYVVVP